jgi:hypothetical protein
MNRTMVMKRPQMDIQIPMKMNRRPNHLRSIAISIIPEEEGEGNVRTFVLCSFVTCIILIGCFTYHTGHDVLCDDSGGGTDDGYDEAEIELGHSRLWAMEEGKHERKTERGEEERGEEGTEEEERAMGEDGGRTSEDVHDGTYITGRGNTWHVSLPRPRHTFIYMFITISTKKQTPLCV